MARLFIWAAFGITAASFSEHINCKDSNIDTLIDAVLQADQFCRAHPMATLRIEASPVGSASQSLLEKWLTQKRNRAASGSEFEAAKKTGMFH